MKSVNFHFIALKVREDTVDTSMLHLVVKFQGLWGKMVPKDHMYCISSVEEYDIMQERNHAFNLTSYQDVFNIELEKNTLSVSLKPEKVADQWEFAYLLEI